jgi:Fe-S-cluster containining protein
MKFPCSGCGCCCKRIKSVVDFLKLKDTNSPLYFPYHWDSKGACNKLNDQNECTVYEIRPLICNVEKLTEFLGYDKKEFYKENILACNKMMDEDGIPSQFRIS